MKGPTDVLKTNLVLIHETKVTGLVWINGIEFHVGVRGEGGHFIDHKPTGEGTDLIKG